jgi:tRNA threonylcarbamoyl adenosine modification protein (Sua5/YciO/YrdC/YwlC family)
VVILPALGDPASPAAIEAAIDILAEGFPVAIPTDTVYGLAVDPTRPGATDRLFEVKRRPHDVSLPLLVADLDQALSVSTAVPPTALVLMRRFWPGPLTIVLPSRPGLGLVLGDDEATVGVRCPDHAVPLALCRTVGPLATTSANRHGEPTAVTAAEVTEVFGDAVRAVLDGGTCRGSPSTVVDCTGRDPKLLREGRLPWGDLVAVIDRSESPSQ